MVNVKEFMVIVAVADTVTEFGHVLLLLTQVLEALKVKLPAPDIVIVLLNVILPDMVIPLVIVRVPV